jgi:hypothetical protein
MPPQRTALTDPPSSAYARPGDAPAARRWTAHASTPVHHCRSDAHEYAGGLSPTADTFASEGGGVVYLSGVVRVRSGVCGRGAVASEWLEGSWQWGGGFGGVVGRVTSCTGIGVGCWRGGAGGWLPVARVEQVVRQGVRDKRVCGFRAFGGVWMGVGGAVSVAGVWECEGGYGSYVGLSSLGMRGWRCGGCWCCGTWCSGCGWG